MVDMHSFERRFSDIYHWDPQISIPSVTGLCNQNDPRLIPELFKALDRHERGMVVYALGKFGKMHPEHEKIGDIVSALAEILKNEKSMGASNALSEIGKPAIPALIALLENENQDVRYYAVQSLSQKGNIEAVPFLIKTMKDKSSKVRHRCANALGQIEDERAVPVLSEALANDRNVYVRIAAASSLESIGNSPAISALVWTLKDKKRKIRLAASKVLIYTFKNCKSVEDMRDFMRKLESAVSDARAKTDNHDEMVIIEFQVAELKAATVKKMNKLAGKRDAFLDGRPKPAPSQGATPGKPGRVRT